MGGENDGAAAQAQVAGEPQAAGDQAAQAKVTAGLQGSGVADRDGNGAVAVQAQKDYEAALAERDARIAELEGEIAEAAKTAEGAEALRKEMDELRRQGDEQRVGFELQLVFGQVFFFEMGMRFFRVRSRNFFGFRHGHAASFLTCPA